MNIKQPYNFQLSVSAVHSFSPRSILAERFLRLPVRLGGTATILEIRQDDTDAQDLVVTANPAVDAALMLRQVEWILDADMDLTPFYRLVDSDALLGPVVHRLWGLKPMRPASLFEMAVIAVTEQQISLTAAYRIRQRLVERFGEPIDGTWVFPSAAALADASPEDLRACGLSNRKAEYINGIARRVMDGSLDFERLVGLSDDAAREVLLGIRGFGRWSADYLLVRGLARTDCLPSDDLGILSVVGQILGDGQRLARSELERLMLPYAPYRGLAAFYMLVWARLPERAL